jgi:putative oxidoreductase
MTSEPIVATYPSAELSSSNRRASLHDVGLLLVRLMLAAVFTFHGSQKLFGLFGGYGIAGTAQWLGSIGVPMPTVAAVASGSAEFFGGLLLAFGLFFRPAAAVMAFNMAVATWTHAAKGFDVQRGGAEYPLTLAVVLAALVLTGPGRIALHSLFARRGRAGR